MNRKHYVVLKFAKWLFVLSHDSFFANLSKHDVS